MQQRSGGLDGAHREGVHRRDHRPRSVMRGAPPTAVVGDKLTEMDMVATQCVHHLEPFEEALSRGHGFQAPRGSRPIPDRHVAALDALGGLASPTGQAGANVSRPRRSALDGLHRKG